MANTAFIPGEIRECTLSVPTHHSPGDNRMVPVHCRVRIVRVEALSERGLYGVGCRIEDYRFLSASPSDGASTAA